MIRALALVAFVALALPGAPGRATGAERPNVLLILADDCTFSDLPVYGGESAETPHIDRLASEGLTFDRAYLTVAMCQPCRSELYSGLYPMRNGCAWNHSASRPGLKTLPWHLGRLGYRCGLAGKVHVEPQASFPFERVPGFDPNCVRDPTRAHDLDGAREFMSRDDDAPFCLVVALVEPHVPWVMGDASAYPPAELALPPNIADTATTRDAYSRYLAEITYMDGQVGELLAALRATDHEDDTLVLFSSEQGAQFPGCKWTNWDTGLHTALIARWPGEVAKGERTRAIVQYADVLPTLIDIAGGEVDGDAFDGTSFVGVLRGETSSHRRYAYGMHNNLPEGPSYPIRTVTDGEHRYIRNLDSERIYIEKHLMGWTGEGKLNNPYWATWVSHAWDDPKTYALVERYLRRPPEELYHTSEDPYELTNLADDPDAAATRDRLREALDSWMESQGDPGAAQDTAEALGAARRGRHLHGVR